MKNDQADLEQRRQGFLKRLIFLKEKYQTEERLRKHLPEIEDLEGQIKVIDEQLEAKAKEEAKVGNEEDVREARAIVDEYKKGYNRLTQMHIRFNELAAKCEARSPKRRVQISSKYFVTMTREVEESHFAGFEQSGEMETIGPLALGPGMKPIFKKEKKTVEMLVPCIPSTLQNCFEAGWALKEGEVIEQEELTGYNSVLQPIVSLPQIFYDEL